MASKPTQRSLKHLRDNGWTVCIVEKFIKHPNMPFGKRIDAFGIGDLLACRPDTYGETCPTCKGDGKLRSATGLYAGCTCDRCHGRGKLQLAEATIALVQCCSTDFAKHKIKLLSIPELKTWKDAGGEVMIHSWTKRGPRGKRKTYQLREEFL